MNPTFVIFNNFQYKTHFMCRNKTVNASFIVRIIKNDKSRALLSLTTKIYILNIISNNFYLALSSGKSAAHLFS